MIPQDVIRDLHEVLRLREKKLKKNQGNHLRELVKELEQKYLLVQRDG